jgi:phage tail tape-measure protein
VEPLPQTAHSLTQAVVGAVVGVAVGAVGTVVGAAVGTAVGALVGDAVGTTGGEGGTGSASDARRGPADTSAPLSVTEAIAIHEPE